MKIRLQRKNGISSKKHFSHPFFAPQIAEPFFKFKKLQSNIKLSNCQINDPFVPLGGKRLFFLAGKNTLDIQAQSIVHHIFFTWKIAGGKSKIRIDGFSSTDGNASNNLILSCRRGQQVSKELQTLGVPFNLIELHGQGETSRFSKTSLRENRCVQVFMDISHFSGFETAKERQRKQSKAKGVINNTLCNVSETPKFTLNSQGEIHIDIGGEGHNIGANNLNPRSRNNSNQLIPNHVCGVGESIPAATNTVDRITLEGTVLSKETSKEIARVIKSGSSVRLVSPRAKEFENAHDVTLQEINSRHNIDSLKTKMKVNGKSASGKPGMVSFIKLK